MTSQPGVNSNPPSPTPTSNSEVEVILEKYAIFGTYEEQIDCETALTNLIAQEANKARIDELKKLVAADHMHTTIGDFRDYYAIDPYVNERLAQLTPHNRSSNES